MDKVKRTLIYVVTEDWYFLSHRLPLARAARNAGYDVVVLTRVNAAREKILEEGFRLIPMDFSRASRSVLNEIRIVLELIRVYRKEKPLLVHHVSIKPVVHGTLAARIARVPAVVNALTGLGYIFSSEMPKARILKKIMIPLLRLLLNAERSWVILQNRDDKEYLQKLGVLRRNATSVIRGSGVDLQAFSPRNPSGEGVLVVFASRMLGDKGIREFVAAAAHLKRSSKARFALVGDTDPENPSAVPAQQLACWSREYGIEWWGKRDDMAEVLNQADIVCLPSYREGLPKVLIEAAACGRPIVATDVPGCREIVEHEQNGLLVPVRDPQALARALKRLIEDESLRLKMGHRGREIACAGFAVERVIEQTLAGYQRLLNGIQAAG